MSNDLFACLPRLTGHTYWHRKANFQLSADAYDYWVMFAVEEGAFRFRIAQDEGVAEFGQLVICPPHVRFGRETLQPLSFHFLAFEWCDSAPMPAHVPHLWTINNRRRLSSNYTYLRQSTLDPRLDLQHKDHFLLDLWRLYVLEQKQSFPLMHTSAHDPVIEAARTILDTGIGKKIDFGNVAAQIGLTPVQLSRRFQRQYHLTPSRYLRRIRLEYARQLLAETDWTLEHIAEQCGYESGFYLSKIFSEDFSLSPSQYRNQFRV